MVKSTPNRMPSSLYRLCNIRNIFPQMSDLYDTLIAPYIRIFKFLLKIHNLELVARYFLKFVRGMVHTEVDFK